MSARGRDLVGRRYGTVVVVEELPPHGRRPRRVSVLVRCDCGRVREILRHNLAGTITCGWECGTRRVSKIRARVQARRWNDRATAGPMEYRRFYIPRTDEVGALFDLFFGTMTRPAGTVAYRGLDELAEKEPREHEQQQHDADPDEDRGARGDDVEVDGACADDEADAARALRAREP